MFSKKMLMSAISVLGLVFALSLCIGFSGGIAIAACLDDEEFTTDFRLEDCKFKDKGENPYFILKPGYRTEFVTPLTDPDVEDHERSVETVLRDKKTIKFDGRKIKTRVVEERAYAREVEDGVVVDEELIEISRNWFAICKKTNAVYYFGEDSRDCEDRGGFAEDSDTLCADGLAADSGGSWEAGQPGEDGEIAKPGLIMPGTALLGARYFQEIAPPDAMDRGEIVAMGLEWSENGFNFERCIKTFDTNPAKEECGEDDPKIYCPGVGLVQDQDLELVSYGYGDDDDDDDDD